MTFMDLNLFQLTVIHPQLPAVASASSAIEPSVEMTDKVSKISVQVQPKSSHLKMGVHGVEQPTAFSLGKKDNFLAGGNQQQSKATSTFIVEPVYYTMFHKKDLTS